MQDAGEKQPRPDPKAEGLTYNGDCDCCAYGHWHSQGFIEYFHPEGGSVTTQAPRRPEMIQQFIDATECSDPECWLHNTMTEGHFHVGGGWGVASRSWVLGVRWAASQYEEMAQ